MAIPELVVRRLGTFVLTVFSVYVILVSLVHSWSSPAPQTRFDRMQTDLVLEALANDRSESLLGAEAVANLYKTALQEYLQVADQGEVAIQVGLLHVKNGDRDAAIASWQKQDTLLTSILTQLWQEPPLASQEAEIVIRQNLEGWFYFTALERLYEIAHPQLLSTVRLQATAESEGALIRLLIINAIPLIGSAIGTLLLIFYSFKLKTKETYAWSIPSTGTAILTIMAAWFTGYVLLSQVIPLFLYRFPFFTLSALGKALAIHVSYVFSMLPMIPLLYFSLRENIDLREHFQFALKRISWLAWGLGGYLAAIPLVVLVSLVQQVLLKGHGGGNPLLVLIAQNQNQFSIAILWLTLAVAAPFFEELLFRGFFLSALKQHLPHRTAIGVSGFCFALVHLNVSDLLPLTVLGIVLGVVYSRTRNLLAPLLLHGLWNTGSFISLLLLTG